ncbi:MAG: WG repeat-containing protein [Cyclobacteriaceae bacterium]
MSLLLSLLLLLFIEGPVVITSGSFQGLAYENGEIIIPPVYDALGWSDGGMAVHNEVIGFKENSRWGLINLKNKKLSEPAFVELKPFEKGYILAALKGKFSNLPFYGILDNSGRTLVRFNYMQLQPLTADNILASTYSEGSVYFGVLNYQGEELIPLIYDKIETNLDLIIATRNEKKKLYDFSGSLITPTFIDEIHVSKEGYLLENGGKYGLISKTGKLIHDIAYKVIADHVPYSFNHWEISCLTEDCSTVEVAADSLTINDRQQLVAHLNNTRHFLGGDSAVHFGKKYEIVTVDRGFIVMQNRFDGSFSLIKSDGEKVVEGYQKIVLDDQYFYGKKDNKWVVIDNFGDLLNFKKYDSIGTSYQLNIPVKKNGYWGWIDFAGEKLINKKYDAVAAGADENQFIAQYVHSWGVANFNDSFVVLPKYDAISVANNFYLAKKGEATSLISKKGKVIWQTSDNLIYDPDESILKIYTKNGHIGVVTDDGIIIPAKYDEVKRLNQFLLLKSDGYFTIYNNGNYILDEKDQIQNVLGFSEGYFHILKDGKHGFIDENGKLRIANRYEDAGDFQDNLAAIKIGTKWGFIDASENLVIQPHFEEVSSFQSGLAIAEEQGRFGLIDREGEIRVSFKWKNIERLATGNYLLTDLEGSQGLADATGKIILRPNYETIEDTSLGNVVVQNGQFKGVLDYNGYTIIPFEYEEIKVLGDYLLLLKRKEYVPSQPSPD